MGGMCTKDAFRCARTLSDNLLFPLGLRRASRLSRADRGNRRWTGATPRSDCLDRQCRYTAHATSAGGTPVSSSLQESNRFQDEITVTIDSRVRSCRSVAQTLASDRGFAARSVSRYNSCVLVYED